MTDLTKPVKRRTMTCVRDRGKSRRLVVTVYPNGTLGLRPEKTRHEEIITVDSCWSLAVKQRVAKEKAEKKAKRAAMQTRVVADPFNPAWFTKNT